MRSRLILILSCVAAGSAVSLAVDMPAGHVMVTADNIAWGVAPGLPAGSMMAVISGDPSQAGSLFTLRTKVPAGYKVPPHWHPTDEHITVLSGSVAMGMGDTWDDKAFVTMPPGSYSAIPANTRHYLLAKTAAIVQVHGVGPFVRTYVNPKDDPRLAPAATTK